MPQFEEKNSLDIVLKFLLLISACSSPISQKCINFFQFCHIFAKFINFPLFSFNLRFLA